MMPTFGSHVAWFKKNLTKGLSVNGVSEWEIGVATRMNEGHNWSCYCYEEKNQQRA